MMGERGKGVTQIHDRSERKTPSIRRLQRYEGPVYRKLYAVQLITIKNATIVI